MTDQEVLAAIEVICGDEFCEDLAMRDLKAGSDLKTAADKLSAIYRIAHSYVQAHICYRVHEAWRREAERIRWSADHDSQDGSEATVNADLTVSQLAVLEAVRRECRSRAQHRAARASDGG